MKLQKNSVLRYTLIIAVSLGALTGAWYYHEATRDGVVSYKASRDRTFIIDTFKRDWHWLVSEYTLDFSPEFMLDTRSSDREPQHRGNLTVLVYRAEGKPEGFVTFYTKSFYSGYILFLGIAPEARRLGYARQLLTKAFEMLKKHGLKVAQLVTRTTNIPAQTLYRNVGFVETFRDDGFVWFEKRL